MRDYLMGIDVGTSACKVSVFDGDGALLSAASSGYALMTPRPGWVEQDPDDWWRAVCAACKEALDGLDAGRIAGVGIDGQSWAAVALDGDGQPLCPTPIWMDTRAEGLCRELDARLGERLFAVSGNPLSPSYTLPKVLYWQRHAPDMLARTGKVLQCNGYIAYRLTGTLSHDVSQGYGWQVFDQRRLTWDRELCREVGLPERLLPELAACHEVVGRVTEAAARLTGLAPGTPVVAGGLDAACGTLGAGVLHAGQTQEQGGQAGGMSICIDQYAADPRLILSAHVVPGRWLLQGGTTGGGGTLNWFARELAGYAAAEAAERDCSVFEVLSEEAEAVPPGSDGLFFLPYMSGERSPLWDPNARGVFFGLGYDKSRGHLVRAMMEGTAFALQHNLEVAAAAGAEVDAMVTVGGAGNSRVWTQIKCDVTGKAIEVARSDTATTLGAAMLAGVGVGLYPDFDAAVQRCVRLTRRQEPNPDTAAAYRRSYDLYRKLYPALHPLMDEVAGWKE